MGVVANLSVKISANMADFEKGMRDVEAPMDKFHKALTTAGVAAGAAFIYLADQAFDMAEKVHDTALQLGISTDAVQRFSFAAEQTGTSIEVVAKAIHFMSKALSEGSPKTQQALDALGLTLGQVMNMKPEDRFNLIADAIGKMENPAKRADVATQLMSRNSLALLPGMVEGWKELGDQAPIMAQKTIDGLDSAKDAWSRLGQHATVLTGNILQAFMDIGNAPVSGMVASMAGTTAAAMQDAATEANIASGKMRNDIDLVNEGTKENTLVTDEATRAAEAHAKALAALGEKLSGAGLKKEVNDLSTAYERMNPAQRENAVVTERMVVEIDRLRAAGAVLAPNLLELHNAHQKNLGVRQQEEKLLLDLASRESAYAFILEKTRSVLPQVTAEEQKRMSHNAALMEMEAAQARGMEEYNGYLQHNAYLQSVATAELENAKEPLVMMPGLMKTVADAFTGGFLRIITGAVSFGEGLKNIFTSLWTQLLGDFVNRFLGGMMNAMLGSTGGFSAAFSGMFGNFGGISGSMGSMSGSIFASSLASALYAGGAAFGIYKFWDFVIGKWTGGESPERNDRIIGYRDGDPNQPVMAPGIEQEEYDRRYGGPDYNHTTDDQAQRDDGTSEPDWSHLHGFASGGYGDFGSGTPVMLHGKEYIIPESQMGGLGGVSVTINANGSIFADDRGAQRLAEIVSRKLQGVMARYQPA
jgi:hypothetical protein